MAQRRDRVIALALAVVFFATSVGVSGLVIWELVRDDSSSSSEQDSLNKLQGTQLEGFDPVENVGALQKIDLQEGSGAEVKVGDTIEVDYTGAVAATGTIFQSSLDNGQPATLTLAEGSIIKGWVDGIPGMKEGGKRRIIIPAVDAYGENPPSGIPANADLVFDVTVYAIVEGEQEQ